MKKLTFKHGIRLDGCKEKTAALPIRETAPPKLLYFPLQQHIGAPLTALVRPGDFIHMGQKLADSDAPLSVPLHASVSGKVLSVGMHPHPNGSYVKTIVIENDGLDTPSPPLHHKSPESMSRAELIHVIREAGIVGMGGAGFPTHIKLSPSPGKTITNIIVNGAECEPYLTSDHRVMLEQTDEVLHGLLVVMRLFPQAKATIAVEENKSDAIQKLFNHIQKQHLNISLLTLLEKYPQGSEKHLIYAATGREVPSGGLPMDVGCVVLNIDTVTAIARAVLKGLPLMRRIVTVSGNVIRQPGNFSVRIGTPFSDVIEAAGGAILPIGKIIMGGPMMGVSGFSTEAPVVKATSSVLLLTREEACTGAESPCIRCGRCAAACPMRLRPLFLNSYVMHGDWEKCRDENIFDCIECGCCSYVCPSKRNIVQSVRLGKVRAKVK